MGIADGHRNRTALLQLRGIEVSGTEEDRHHVEDTVLILRCLPFMITMTIDTMFLQTAVTIGIAVPYLVNVIAVALACAFPEIKRREIRITIGYQRIAHREVLVEFVVAPSNEIRLPCILPLKLRESGIHRGGAHLHPDELPVEVQIIGERLARLKGRVLYATLGETVDSRQLTADREE